MNLEILRDYCLSLPGVTEGFPFGEQTLVFKVGGKVFLLTPMDSVKLRFNVKCDPEKAQRLREEYDFVHPGYHMNKKHWNTVHVAGVVSEDLLTSWIKDSYTLVLESLPKKVQLGLSSGSNP